MHKDISERIIIQLQHAIDTHNDATNIVAPSFMVIDYFIVCKTTKPAHKLALWWSGYLTVATVKSFMVCVVEDLLNRRKETVHFIRLKSTMDS